jgi:hypothetical protein
MAFTQFGTLIGQYNASLPTLTDGDIAVVSLDSNGRAMVSDGGGSLTVDGTVAVSSIAGTVAVTQSTSPWVVDGSGVTQPVSGTFWQATQPISAVSLPLPTGASTLAEQQTQTTALQLIDDIVLTDGAAWVAGSKGVEGLAVRQDAAGPLSGVADGDLTPLQVNANGELKVTGTFNVAVDDVFESGTEADLGSDATGDGVVPVTTAAFAEVVKIPVAAGDVLYLTGLDVSSDKQVQWELIVDDDGTPTTWLRTGVLNSGMPNNCSYERAIEVPCGADISVILRAQSLKGSRSVGGGINAYVRTP